MVSRKCQRGIVNFCVHQSSFELMCVVALLCLALGIEGEIVLVAFSVLRLGLNGLIRFSR